MVREIVITGYAGPIIGVVEVTAEQLSAWRSCVLCGWQSRKFVTQDADQAIVAGKSMVSEQSEHLQKKHPDMIENVLRDAGEAAFAPMMGRC